MSGFPAPLLALVAVVCLTGCAGNESSAVAAAERAYALYDSRVDRELVAGRDDVRGNYVELRLSPKLGDGRLKMGDGKAVVR